MDGGLFYFYLILCFFPDPWRDLTSYKLLMLRTYSHFSGFCSLRYDRASGKHAATVKLKTGQQ